MKGRTRRQEIIGEYRMEQIRVIALIVSIFVLLISLGVSCGRSCGCGSCGSCGGSEPDRQDSPQTSAADSGKLVLTAEDTRFLYSLNEYPRLVNNDNPLPIGYEPPGLVPLHGMPGGNRNKLNLDAANAFYQLRNAMLEDGMAVDPLSGYRTYDEQVAIYNNEIQKNVDAGMTPEEARADAELTIAIPGTSEHQYGRSIDVTIDGHTDHSFHLTEHGKWLIDHAHEHGFVIRYPADKTEITGISYEPWHLRWVGKEHAEFMHRHGLCLEEYVQLIGQYNPEAVMSNE